MQIVGYQLVDVKTGAIVAAWGGEWNRCPGKPEMFIAPNGDHVHCPELDVNYSGVVLKPWMMGDPRFYADDGRVRSVDACQGALISEVNGFVASELSKSDWKIIRGAEGYKDASASLLAYRKALRDHGNTLVAEIKSLKGFDQIMAWQPHDWPIESDQKPA